MIYFVDNFLSQELLDEFLQDDSEFFEFPTEGKSFWVRFPSNKFNQYVISEIEKIENKKVQNILSFFREAKEGQDNNWRIHNDARSGAFFGHQPHRAIVLFMESEETDSLNGTAFWEHEKYGDVYFDRGDEHFDEILKSESEKREVWTLKSVVGYRQNRLLSYPCNYFHSKYPNEFKQPRRVFVMFYKVN